MKRALSLTSVLFMVVLLAGFAAAADKKPVAKKTVKPGGVVVDVVKATAVIDAVDTAKRTVTVKMPDGSLKTVKMGPEVKNFDRIKAGDRVNMTFYQSVAIIVAKAGEKPSASEVQTVEVAPKGAKPGAVVVDTMEITAKVEGVNYKKRTVTLKGPEGNVRTFAVDKAVKNFKNIKKGDDVFLKVTEAMAVKVEAAGK